MEKDPYKIRFADILLAVLIILISLGIYGYIFIKGKNSAAELAVVTVNGKEYGRYSLSEDRTVTVRTDGGYNKIEIKDGKVMVVDADCPDKCCVSGGISKKGEIIVCLPHKLTVEIDDGGSKSSESSDIDALAK